MNDESGWTPTPEEQEAFADLVMVDGEDNVMRRMQALVMDELMTKHMTTQEILGTEGKTNAEILASDQIIYQAPRKKYAAGYRAGYTKNKNQGTTKRERQRRKAARRLNRR